jgi:acyl-CoA thioester hydrolase
MNDAAGLPAYPVKIEAEWIDFNGHVRDAFYTLAASYATDAAMDHVGLDAGYRQRTGCTLYTLELHIHYLREVKRDDELTILTSVFDFDRKRVHLGCRFVCARLEEAAATAEFMLIHVHQGDKPSVRSFPDDVSAKLAALKSAALPREQFAPASRKIEMKPASSQPPAS